MLWSVSYGVNRMLLWDFKFSISLIFTCRDLIYTCDLASVAVIKVNYYYYNIMMCNFYHKFNGPNVELGHHGLYPLYLYLLYLSHSSAHSETSSSLILCAK